MMLERAREIYPQLVEWRRDIHMYPELGFEEVRTSAKVADTLERSGYRVRRGVGRTGVVAEKGSGPRVFAIRADMDALPIQEANEVPYASRKPGVMHACGHDAHTAMALGAATLLAEEEFTGCVRFLFQPAEEMQDEEGLSGAPAMIRDGAMQDVNMVIALHVDAVTPVGTIRIESGPASGGVDSFFGRVIGKGGHGAKPHEVIDPFYITAHVILALNGIVSRRLHPFDPAVVSIGAVHGGNAENVIPRQVDIAGTIRFTEPKVQKQLHAEIKRAFELARTLGGNYELNFDIGNPPMINHPKAVEVIKMAALELLGPEHVLPPIRELGAEDFGCFSEVAPGAMFILGTLIEGDQRIGHNPHFDINESALPVGTAVLAESALRFLRAKKPK
ncbi:MAG: M20 family metallopeptidase [Chloroflexota bacterium]